MYEKILCSFYINFSFCVNFIVSQFEWKLRSLLMLQPRIFNNKKKIVAKYDNIITQYVRGCSCENRRTYVIQ